MAESISSSAATSVLDAIGNATVGDVVRDGAAGCVVDLGCGVGDRSHPDDRL